MFRGVIFVFSGVMLGFRRVIFGSEGLYRVQWGYVVSIQHVDLPPCGAGSAVKKTKTILFNYTSNYQFTTRLLLKIEPVEVIDSTRLLGTIISNDVSWDQNI